MENQLSPFINQLLICFMLAFCLMPILAKIWLLIWSFTAWHRQTIINKLLDKILKLTYTLPMKQETYEPRSAEKSSPIFNSPLKKEKKRLWNFRSVRERGQLAELPTKIKPVTFGSKVYQFGIYQGTLDDIKEFAKMKGCSLLTNGAIKYKIG